MITNKYKYPELKRIENTLGRFYIDPENNEVPSVTTVLDNMSDKKSSLSEWRNRVGDIEADRVMKEATDIGTMVHLSLENHLNGIDEDIFTDNSLGNMAKRMSKKLIDDINSRYPGLKRQKFSLNKYIYSIQNFESISVFNINRELSKINKEIRNNKISTNPKEFRTSLSKDSFFFKIKNLFKTKTNFTYLIFLINSFKLRNFFK